MQLLQFLVPKLPFCATKTMAINLSRKNVVKMLMILESLKENQAEERQRDVWTRAWIKRRE